MPLASPYTWNEQVKTIRLRSGAISRTDENSSQLQMVLFRRAAELNMLLTVRPEEERYGLSAGAGGVRTEQAVACTVGDAVFNGPRHRLGVVAACGNIRKADRALRFGRTGGTQQEGDDLGAGAVQVSVEMIDMWKREGCCQPFICSFAGASSPAGVQGCCCHDSKTARCDWKKNMCHRA